MLLWDGVGGWGGSNKQPFLACSLVYNNNYVQCGWEIVEFRIHQFPRDEYLSAGLNYHWTQMSDLPLSTVGRDNCKRNTRYGGDERGPGVV